MIQSEYEKRQGTPCVPSAMYLRRMDCFWVAKRDYDGRLSTFVQVWQWQPGVKAWCKPGFGATGQEEKLMGYEILGICPMPLSGEETKELQNNLRKLKQRIGNKQQTQITKDEFESIFNAVDSLSRAVTF